MNPVSRILDTNGLMGSNFNDWQRNLKIVLNSEKIGYILNNPIPTLLPSDSSDEEKVTFATWQDDDLKVRSYMLASMSNEL